MYSYLFFWSRNLLHLMLTAIHARAHCCLQGYRWYLDRVQETVDTARRATGSEAVDLVGHSAGGWLARAYLADPKYGIVPPQRACMICSTSACLRVLCFTSACLPVTALVSHLSVPRYFEEACHARGCHSAIRTLCTLGTPHSPPPAGRMRDMTGGALTWVNSQWPGVQRDTN